MYVVTWTFLVPLRYSYRTFLHQNICLGQKENNFWNYYQFLLVHQTDSRIDYNELFQVQNKLLNEKKYLLFK